MTLGSPRSDSDRGSVRAGRRGRLLTLARCCVGVPREGQDQARAGSDGQRERLPPTPEARRIGVRQGPGVKTGWRAGGPEAAARSGGARGRGARVGDRFRGPNWRKRLPFANVDFLMAATQRSLHASRIRWVSPAWACSGRSSARIGNATPVHRTDSVPQTQTQAPPPQKARPETMDLAHDVFDRKHEGAPGCGDLGDAAQLAAGSVSGGAGRHAQARRCLGCDARVSPAPAQFCPGGSLGPGLGHS